MFEPPSPDGNASRRILIVDDNAAIHEDFQRILGGPQRDSNLENASSALFGAEASIRLSIEFELESASQGKEALEKVQASCDAGRPFGMAFVDMRMPPGWDGIETIRRLWKVDPRLQVVICTAYSDYSWAEIVAKLGYSDRVLILKKPFDHTEVCQLALALTEKRKLADIAELKLNALQAVVEQQTCELRERDEQLRQKQKLEALGSLAGGIAHEFNNLLQAIQGYASFAAEGLAADEQRSQDLEQVQVAAKRAADVTSRLLNFSRRGSSEPQVLAVNDIVRDSLILLKPLIGEQIDLQADLTDADCQVEVDTSLFGQVLMNLCINARDAMPLGGRLTVAVEQLSTMKRDAHASLRDLAAGPCVDISVSDTGCGMSADVMRKIFDPFFTTKQAGEGTGLGLSTAYGIVQQHGGAIDVESRVNVGSTFHVYLPLVKPASPMPAPPTSWTARQGGDEVILVAEDDPTIRRLAVRMLGEAGYRTVSAVDGTDAVRKFQQHRDEVNLLLLDVVMPRLSGYDAYAEIKKSCPDVAGILCTGYDPGVVCVATETSSQLPVLAKPFCRDELFRVVREMLDARAPCLQGAR